MNFNVGTFSLLFALFIGTASAQTVSYESVRLAEIVVAENQTSTKRVFAEIASQGKANGLSKKAADIFVEELMSAFTKLLAGRYSNELSEAEIGQAITFSKAPPVGSIFMSRHANGW